MAVKLRDWFRQGQRFFKIYAISLELSHFGRHSPPVVNPLSLSFLIFVTAASATLPAPPHVRSAPMFGQSYVDLNDWAQLKHFDFSWNTKEDPVELTNRWARLSFVIDSRRAVVNGVSVWLSFPIVPRNGSANIAFKDLKTVIEPILYPIRKPRLSIKTVAIAAGHGGKDPGNHDGLHQEKQYALLLATELEKILLQSGLNVVQARSTDKFIPLEDQPALARKKGADVFLCLHYNSTASLPRGETNSAKGVEVYCLSSPGTSSTNGGEDSVRAYEGNRHDEENVLLAYSIQNSIVKSVDIADRGVRRARFVVLRDATMPAVLIEGGFMSNKEDARKIYDSNYREQMAQAIADGLLAYKRLVERPLTVK